MSMLSPEQLAELMRLAMQEVLDSRARIPELEHREHHAWVQAQIERQRARAEFWTSLAGKAVPAMVWTLISAAAVAIFNFVRSHITWS